MVSCLIFMYALTRAPAEVTFSNELAMGTGSFVVVDWGQQTIQVHTHHLNQLYFRLSRLWLVYYATKIWALFDTKFNGWSARALSLDDTLLATIDKTKMGLNGHDDKLSENTAIVNCIIWSINFGRRNMARVAQELNRWNQKHELGSDHLCAPGPKAVLKAVQNKSTARLHLIVTAVRYRAELPQLGILKASCLSVRVSNYTPLWSIESDTLLV